jgi:hypothetical protein
LAKTDHGSFDFLLDRRGKIKVQEIDNLGGNAARTGFMAWHWFFLQRQCTNSRAHQMIRSIGAGRTEAGHNDIIIFFMPVFAHNLSVVIRFPASISASDKVSYACLQ